MRMHSVALCRCTEPRFTEAGGYRLAPPNPRPHFFVFPLLPAVVVSRADVRVLTTDREFWASCLSKRAVFCRSSAGGLIGRVGPSMAVVFFIGLMHVCGFVSFSPLRKDFKRREDPQKSTILSRTAAVFELPIRSGRNTPHPQLKPPFLRPHSPLHPRPVPHLGRWLGIGGCWRGGGWWGVGWWRKPENRPLWHVGDWGFRVKEDE
nr:uncharacterized protein LOC116151404 isoform X3 [Camelus dromedarius]